MQETNRETTSRLRGDDLLQDRDLAARWRKSVRTLQRWRAEGYGPASLQIGGTIFYRLEDVLAFEARVRSGGEEA